MNELLNLEIELANNVRRQTLNGREFVVADVIMLREGVLNGSKGPLFYPADEIVKRPGVWNGFPLTAPTHPMKDGKPISGRTPEAWNRYTVGYLFNDKIVENTRQAEIWVDVEVANKIEPRLIPKILSGEKINVSTGLFTSDEKAPDGAVFNGKAYTHIARNYQPDHLAILLDDLGACSVRDRCGININSGKGVPESCPYCGTGLEIDPDSHICNRCGKKVPVTNSSPEENRMRPELVQWLTTNCDCYKNKAAVLNDEKAFTVEELKSLKENHEASTLAVNTLKAIGTEVKAPAETTLANLPAFVKNAMGKKSDCDDDDAAMDKKKKDAVAMNAEELKNGVLNTLKNLSEKEYLDNAPPAINALVTEAKATLEEKRIALIGRLTANIINVEEKKAAILALKDQTPATLNLMVKLLPGQKVEAAKDDNEKFLANFFGANNGGAPASGTPTYNRGDVLLPHLFNGSEEVEVEVA